MVQKEVYANIFIGNLTHIDYEQLSFTHKKNAAYGTFVLKNFSSFSFFVAHCSFFIVHFSLLYN